MRKDGVLYVMAETRVPVGFKERRQEQRSTKGERVETRIAFCTSDSFACSRHGGGNPHQSQERLQNRGGNPERERRERVRGLGLHDIADTEGRYQRHASW